MQKCFKFEEIEKTFYCKLSFFFSVQNTNNDLYLVLGSYCSSSTITDAVF